VGVNPNSPQNPHSAPSSGGSDIANIDTSPKVAAYVLYGAVVGGPDRSGRFWDLRSDWIQSEVGSKSMRSVLYVFTDLFFQVALDYNAPLLTLAAYHVMNDTSDPYYTQLKEGEYEARRPQGRPCDASQDCSHGSTSTKLPRAGQIALGVIISVVGLVIVGLLAYWAVIELRGSPGKG
jgi:endoglucanase